MKVMYLFSYVKHWLKLKTVYEIRRFDSIQQLSGSGNKVLKILQFPDSIFSVSILFPDTVQLLFHFLYFLVRFLYPHWVSKGQGRM